jgi:hypothetical protein
MGYLNNTIVTVDAILTKKGRELLAQGAGAFNITKFALSDDEIDYTLYNPSHPSGSAYYGEAIENMPLLEAFPDETQIMKYKLTTATRGTYILPFIASVAGNYKIVQANSQTITPTTSRGGSLGNVAETYSFTLSDVRLYSTINIAGVPGTSQPSTVNVAQEIAASLGTNVSRTYVGTGITLTATSTNVLFGSSTSINSLLIIQGNTSGARLQVPITITKSA